MKKAFKLFIFILIGAAFAFNFASCDDISFTYRRHQDKDKDGSQSQQYYAKLNAGDVFWNQYEDVYLEVNSYGNIDFYYWDVDTYSYESLFLNAYYNIDNSEITITYSDYDYKGNYYTDTFTGNFDGTTMTLFNDGCFWLTFTKVTSVPHSKLNAGDIFLEQDEDVYLKVNSDGNIDFYEWNEDTYSYELSVSNAYYNIDNSEITITYSYYDDYEGNYRTVTHTGNFDGITMTFFYEDELYWTFTKVTSVPRILKTATDFSTITLENNWPYNNHAMIEWIASDNKYKLNAGQRIKFTIRGVTYDDITVSKTKFTAGLVDTTSYANGWRELSDYVNAQDGTMLDYYSNFEAVFIIELTSTPSNASAEACKFELSVGETDNTQDDITISVSAFEVELLE